MRPIVQSAPDDCVHACVCSVLGLAPDELSPLARRQKVDPDRWWVYGSEMLRSYGLCLVETSAAYVRQSHLSHSHWIALVPSLFCEGGHAVVMRGNSLVHDPARSEPRYTTEMVWACGASLTAAVIGIADPSLIVDLRRAAA